MLRTSNLVGMLIIACPSCQWQIVTERGVVRVMWPILEFYTRLHIFGMAKAGDFKFCAKVGHEKYYPSDDKLPPSGRGQGHMSHSWVLQPEISQLKLWSSNFVWCRLYQMLGFGLLTIPERRMVPVMWPILEFYTPLKFLWNVWSQNHQILCTSWPEKY